MKLIVARTSKNGIGYNGRLPWRSIPGDLEIFKELTLGGAVIMGRKTWESLPTQSRPLPGRLNIVISRTLQQNDNATSHIVVSSLDKALTICDIRDIENVWVIGGAQIYAEALKNAATTVYVVCSEIKGDYECDTFFPCKLEPTSDNELQQHIRPEHHKYFNSETDQAFEYTLKKVHSFLL